MRVSRSAIPLVALGLFLGLSLSSPKAEAGWWHRHKTWRTYPSEGYQVPLQQVWQFPASFVFQPGGELFPTVPFRYEALYPGLGPAGTQVRYSGPVVVPGTAVGDSIPSDSVPLPEAPPPGN